MNKKPKLSKEIRNFLGGDDPLTALRELTEEEVFRMENEKFGFYVPNGKCEEFITAVGSGDYFVVVFSAANGVGKTCAGANTLVHFIFKSDNPWFDLPLFRNFPYRHRGRIVTDPKSIENMVRTIKEWMPQGKFKQKKAGKSYISVWEYGDWTIDIMSYEQDPKEFEAETLGFCWFDEPPPAAIYKATVARMRMGGIMFFTETPLAGSGWISESFRSGETEVEGLNGEKIRRKVKYIEADVEAACKTHGIRGHLTHENINQMIAEYSEDERQARVYGKSQHLVGLVFKQFSRDIHVIKPFDVNPRDFCVMELLDPHPRNPDAAMWLAIDRKGTKYVVDELYLKCQNGDDELAQRIKGVAKNYRIIRRLADPSAFIEDQHTKKSLAKSLSARGLSYLEATKMRSVSDRRIATALSYNRLPDGQFIKAPEIYVFDTCRRTIWEFEHLRWDEWTGKMAEKRDAKESPVDKDDHMIENLGRGLIQEPMFVPLPPPAPPMPGKNYDPYDNPIK